MKTYAITSHTDYGDVILIINADDIHNVRQVADDNDCVWVGYNVEEIDTTKKGVVFIGGGD
jgi:hypothetical protein